MQRRDYFEWGIGIALSAFLLAGVIFQFLPTTLTEVLGFITGGVCVWLTVKQNIWCMPIGIANNIFFIVLFWDAKLYADMALQGVYIVLGFLGWYWWLYGGDNRERLRVSRATLPVMAVLAGLCTAGTITITMILLQVSAPVFDALTTCLSLVAQFMLTRKLIENWLVWITADVIYIGLYAYKGLYLTSILYFIFLGMCVVGYLNWRRDLQAQTTIKSLQESVANV
jgi:nicotinamide mononucleotide transporter